MRSKLFIFAAVAAFGLGFASCDEDNDQLIDVELNDEQLLVASNTSGKLIKIQTGKLNEPDRKDITVPYADGDGIGLRGDDLISTNRSDNKIHLLNDVFDKENEGAVRVETTSGETISNARGVAVDRELGGTNVAVAQSGSAANGNVNKILLYRAERSDLELKAEVTVDFALWGLEWDGSTLLAVVDMSDSVAVFENFDKATTGTLEPTYFFRVEGLTRTHGIAFGKDDDILILTDIGASTDATVDDGAFHFVKNWRGAARADAKSKNVLEASRQVRVAGMATLLRNPVDVAYDDDNNRIYIAERATDGGRLLAFEVPTANGSPAPVFNEKVAGASSVEYRD